MNSEQENPEQKKLFLLDAYALIYRAYFAFIKNPRINSRGLNTSAILGFANTLIDVLHNEKPSHICVVFDTPEPTFRHKMFAEYKANREAMPEDLRMSIPYIKKLIDAFNIKQISKPGFEADDVIGTLAHTAANEGFDTYMMTPDKDYTQLVKPSVKMYKPSRSGNTPEILGVEEVKEKFGIEDPKQVIDILALWGDSSDNIPGAPGIGEKTAKKIIGRYGSIEGMYENLEDLKPKQRENVIAFKDQIELSRTLVKIITDVQLDVKIESFKSEEPDYESLKSLFEELEFRNLANRILKTPEKQEDSNVQFSLFDQNSSGVSSASYSPAYENITSVKHEYKLVETQDDIEKLVKLLSNEKSFCFDTETTGLDSHSSKLVGISFSIKSNEAWYIPFPQDAAKAKSIIQTIKPLFENAAVSKIGQNIKFDLLMLKASGIQLNGDLFDTMIAHYLLEPDQKHNLNFLSEKYLNYSPVSIESLIGDKKKEQLNMKDVPLIKIKEYAGEDADITLQLKPGFEKELKEKELYTLFNEIEMPLIKVLAEMEFAGISLNDKDLNEFSNELREEIIKTEQKIYSLAGVEFNISSPKQLGEILFNRLKIDENAKKTKTKQYSTGEEVLVRLKNKHEIIPLILDYRSLKKLLNTYVESLPKLINSKTGKIHTSYNQAVAATGRLSSTKPNLQNIPIREEKGREIRKAFVPSGSGNILFSADYSQIELRLMAHMSEDENMINAFMSGADIHAATASKIYNCALENVSPDQRRNAKTANFGIIYGISAFGLSQLLNISRTDAKSLIDSYFSQFPGVKNYMNECIDGARKKGYVKTLLGRRRYLRDINSQNAVIRGMAERNAINAPIQGSAADIIKIAMINILEALEIKNMSSKMILQVHDELVFDVFKPELESIRKLVKNEMENAFRLKVPLTVDMGTGKNWLEAH